MLKQEFSLKKFKIFWCFSWLILTSLYIILSLSDSDWLVNLLFWLLLACWHHDITFTDFSWSADARIMLASIFITMIYHKSAVSAVSVCIFVIRWCSCLINCECEMKMKEKRSFTKRMKKNNTIKNNVTRNKQEKSEWKISERKMHEKK